MLKETVMYVCMIAQSPIKPVLAFHPFTKIHWARGREGLRSKYKMWAKICLLTDIGRVVKS